MNHKTILNALRKAKYNYRKGLRYYDTKHNTYNPAWKSDNILQHGVGAYNQEAFLKYVDSPDNIISASFRKRESGLHPTQKPIDLMKCLIELTTQPDQIVLDPFCGSGTTAVAAKRLGRHFIGIELSPEYCEIARKRVAAVPRRLDSFFPRQPEEDARPC